MRLVTHRFSLAGVSTPIDTCIEFTARERAILRQASEIAEHARELLECPDGDTCDEDADTMLGEIEHGCRELATDGLSLRVA
ncbi:MAG: hypothetical protein U0990_12690 [Candidatus Nanopelagicales bacterium]|nr:hypothetical protein [Candidatus Nanopelagicales bacterium]